jgi:UrcA family protein
MGKTYRKTGISLLIAVGIALPAAAFAGGPGQEQDTSVKVSYEDLNIHSEAGAKALYSRLKRATQKACNVESLTEHGSVDRARDARVCYDEVLSNAVEKIDSDTLTRIHAS